MKQVTFNKWGVCVASEERFFAYVEKTKQRGDYYKEHTNDKGDEMVYYCNSFGCILAEYNRTHHFGKLR